MAARRDKRKAEDRSLNPYGRSRFGARPCSICGDDEPHHVHHGGKRVDDFFTVGRGQSDFDAALSWQRKYQRARVLLEGSEQ